MYVCMYVCMCVCIYLLCMPATFTHHPLTSPFLRTHISPQQSLLTIDSYCPLTFENYGIFLVNKSIIPDNGYELSCKCYSSVQNIPGWPSDKILPLLYDVKSSSLSRETSLDPYFADTKSGTAKQLNITHGRVTSR